MKRSSVVLLLVVSAALMSCDWMPGPMDPKCDQKFVREFPSPGAKRKAIEYHTTCDDNTTHSTIEVADADGRNSATAMHASLANRGQGWPELKVEWKSATELWVRYPVGVDAQCISSPPGVAVHCVDASIVRQ